MFVILPETNILLNTATISVADSKSVTFASGKSLTITEGDYKLLVRTLEAEDKRLFAIRRPR